MTFRNHVLPQTVNLVEAALDPGVQSKQSTAPFDVIYVPTKQSEQLDLPGSV